MAQAAVRRPPETVDAEVMFVVGAPRAPNPLRTQTGSDLRYDERLFPYGSGSGLVKTKESGSREGEVGLVAILTQSITVNAPVEKVFDYALDPRELWSMPNVALADIEIKPDGVGTSARLWSHVLGFHLEGGMEYTEVKRPERIVIEVEFFMEHPTWTFAFEPVDGGTKVTAQGEWNVKTPAVGGRFEKMMVKEHEPALESMLASLKGDLEGAAV